MKSEMAFDECKQWRLERALIVAISCRTSILKAVAEQARKYGPNTRKWGPVYARLPIMTAFIVDSDLLLNSSMHRDEMVVSDEQWTFLVNLHDRIDEEVRELVDIAKQHDLVELITIADGACLEFYRKTCAIMAGK